MSKFHNPDCVPVSGAGENPNHWGSNAESFGKLIAHMTRAYVAHLVSLQLLRYLNFGTSCVCAVR